MTSMTDKSARALRWVDFPSDSIECGQFWHTDSGKAPFGHSFRKYEWRPLENSEQAFRLMVSLNMRVIVGKEFVSAKSGEMSWIEQIEDSPEASVRLAIVTLAASIWESSQS